MNLAQGKLQCLAIQRVEWVLEIDDGWMGHCCLRMICVVGGELCNEVSAEGLGQDVGEVKVGRPATWATIVCSR